MVSRETSWPSGKALGWQAEASGKALDWKAEGPLDRVVRR